MPLLRFRACKVYDDRGILRGRERGPSSAGSVQMKPTKKLALQVANLLDLSALAPAEIPIGRRCARSPRATSRGGSTPSSSTS